MIDPLSTSSNTMYPFHEGEVRMQTLRDVHENVMSYAPQVIRPFMPDQHRDFYEHQPFLVAAALDRSGHMWSTMLFPSDESMSMPLSDERMDPQANQENRTRKRKLAASVVASSTPDALRLRGRVARGDALEGEMNRAGARIGLLGIELGTKRRNRVNGHVHQVHNQNASLSSSASSVSFDVTFEVDQSFGNCPQYITPRPWTWRDARLDKHNHNSAAAARGNELTAAHVQAVQEADTIFIATGYQGGGGHDDGDNGTPPKEDRRVGNDASHRGGPKGFLRVPDAHTILLPDYSGNNHYNSIGNLLLDDRMGMMIPNLDSGSYLQVSGTAVVVTDPDQVRRLYPTTPGSNEVGAVIVLTVIVVNDVPKGSLPIRWSDPEKLQRVRVASIVQESKDVKSFVLEVPREEEAPLTSTSTSTNKNKKAGYRAGQYLPIHVPSSPFGEGGPPLVRTYSLSRADPKPTSGSLPHSYRISVKRHPHGQASQLLHDRVNVGDWLSVEAPAGEFVLPELEHDHDATPIVLLSVGIGVTPVLAMLDELVKGRTNEHDDKEEEEVMKDAERRTSTRRRNVLWVHGARNGAEHPFRDEVRALQELSRRSASAVAVTKHVAYSRPRDRQDRLDMDYDSLGRVDLPLVKSLLSKLRRDESGVGGGGPIMLRDARYYLCGPPGFVADLETGLLQEGVPPAQVNSESF